MKKAKIDLKLKKMDVSRLNNSESIKIQGGYGTTDGCGPVTDPNCDPVKPTSREDTCT